MTDTSLDQETAAPTATTPAAGGEAAPAFDPERRATELAILDALRAVVDPEIGMNVVELALIKQIILGSNETEIKDRSIRFAWARTSAKFLPPIATPIRESQERML